MAKALSTTILGRTELPVTRLGYGAGAVRDSDGEHAETILNTVLDAGINFISADVRCCPRRLLKIGMYTPVRTSLLA